MDSSEWNARYTGTDLVWSAEPNQFLVQEVADLPPGRVLDVACGEGRNAIWLASRGWQATGVDFSTVAIDKARRAADERGVTVTWAAADLAEWAPAAESFDLVIVFYLQLPPEERRPVYRRMATGVAPGGTMLVVGHDSQNLSGGYGGPQDPSVLFSVEDVASDLSALQIVKAEQMRRQVHTDLGEKWAIDALVRAVKP
jgi:2-polyprenyl-3-methyl-5-hydroxy-6-metoxy-1,4-benzoquinol methylase